MMSTRVLQSKASFDLNRALVVRMVEAELNVCLHRLESVDLGIAACHVDHALALVREERERVSGVNAK